MADEDDADPEQLMAYEQQYLDLSWQPEHPSATGMYSGDRTAS